MNRHKLVNYLLEEEVQHGDSFITASTQSQLIFFNNSSFLKGKISYPERIN